MGTFACTASVLVARLPADPQPVSQANQVLREDAASSSSRAMRLTRCRTRVADQDPRPEGVGILRAVSAAARAPDDVTPPARSLVRIGAKLAARASARSDWALEPGLPLVRAWIISHQYLAGGTVHRFTRQPFAPSRFPNPQDRPATSHSFLCRSCNAIFNSYQPSDGTGAFCSSVWVENVK